MSNPQIRFNHEGTDYVLEYTRKSVKTMEDRMGFSISEMERKPATMIPLLFQGAFLANHRFAKQQKVEEIFEELESKQELVAKLMEMYAETLNSLFEDKEESKGNVRWETGS